MSLGVLPPVPTPSGIDPYPPPPSGGGGGGAGTVTSVTAGDETIIIGGTATDPTISNNTTDVLITSVNLTPGLWVNVYDNAGVPTIRKADASLGQGYQCDGFVVDTVLAGNTVKLYTDGMNTHVSGMVASEVWLGNAGLGTNTPPTTAGYISQQIGIATSATEVAFEPQPDILIAATGSSSTGGQMQREEWTAAGTYTFNVPVGVEAGWLTMIGAGAGGKGIAALTLNGGAGGGAGEVCEGMIVPVPSGGSVTVIVGAKGTGAAGANGTNGGQTSFDVFVVKGGIAGTAQAITATSGAGGGVRGGITSAAVGASESACYFGGSSGGAAGSSSAAGAAGAGAPGRLTGGNAGSASGTAGGGGGGAASLWGAGGNAGNGNSNGSNAGGYGAGGGGGGGSNVAGTPTTGGDGYDGYVMFVYIG